MATNDDSVVDFVGGIYFELLRTSSVTQIDITSTIIPNLVPDLLTVHPSWDRVPDLVDILLRYQRSPIRQFGLFLQRSCQLVLTS